jgi:hypothetical protein
MGEGWEQSPLPKLESGAEEPSPGLLKPLKAKAGQEFPATLG